MKNNTLLRLLRNLNAYTTAQRLATSQSTAAAVEIAVEVPTTGGVMIIIIMIVVAVTDVAVTVNSGRR